MDGGYGSASPVAAREVSLGIRDHCGMLRCSICRHSVYVDPDRGSASSCRIGLYACRCFRAGVFCHVTAGSADRPDHSSECFPAGFPCDLSAVPMFYLGMDASRHVRMIAAAEAFAQGGGRVSLLPKAAHPYPAYYCLPGRTMPCSIPFPQRSFTTGFWFGVPGAISDGTGFRKMWCRRCYVSRLFGRTSDWKEAPGRATICVESLHRQWIHFRMRCGCLQCALLALRSSITCTICCA